MEQKMFKIGQGYVAESIVFVFQFKLHVTTRNCFEY